jgi:hypothetical protein
MPLVKLQACFTFQVNNFPFRTTCNPSLTAVATLARSFKSVEFCSHLRVRNFDSLNVRALG